MKPSIFLKYLLACIVSFSIINNILAVGLNNSNFQRIETSNYIISTAKDDQAAPIIAYNSKKNEYLVVWSDERNKSTYGKDIFAKILNSKLEQKGDEFSVNVSSGNQWAMDVAYNSIDDQYLIIWNDDLTGNIQGQLISNSGDLLGGKINIANPAKSYISSLAYNSRDNKYLVVWDEGDISQNKSDIYGQILSRDGTLQGSKFPIVTESYNQYNPVISYNSNDNEFLVVWQDERNSINNVKYVDIYCKRITGLGQLINGDIPISDINDNDYKQLPSVAYNSTRNEYLIVWTQGKTLSSMNIYGRLVKNNGIMEDDAIILCSAYGKQSNPDVAYNSEDKEYLIVWDDARGANLDIYGQKLSQTGQLIGGNFAISTALEDQDYPKIVFNNVENNYLVVWSDNRNKIVNAGDIYAQIISNPDFLLKIEPDILYADGKSTATVTLTLKGMFGEPLIGKDIDIKVTKGQGNISSDIKDNGDGTYTAIYTASNQTGTETITATALNKTKSIDIKLIGVCRKGDVDGNGVVNSKDAMLVLQFIVNLKTLTDTQKCSADVIEDGEIKVNDAIKILQIAVGAGAPPKDNIKTDNITVSIDKIQGILGKNVLVPIMVNNINEVAGGDISISFNSSVLKVKDVLSDNIFSWNLIKSGNLRIAFANSQMINQKVLALISFDVIDNNFSPIDLSDINLYNSSGKPLMPKVINGEFMPYNMTVDQNGLFQNFPNPFNPETWIPYQLKDGSEVVIKIFSANGDLIREFNLGYKPAGIYTNCDRAVYWDGKDKSGISVASGIYFYSIYTGDFHATRKMIVLR